MTMVYDATRYEYICVFVKRKIVSYYSNAYILIPITYYYIMYRISWQKFSISRLLIVVKWIWKRIFYFQSNRTLYYNRAGFVRKGSKSYIFLKLTFFFGASEMRVKNKKNMFELYAVSLKRAGSLRIACFFWN